MLKSIIGKFLGIIGRYLDRRKMWLRLPTNLITEAADQGDLLWVAKITSSEGL